MTIAADAGYLVARPCAKSCIQDYGGNGKVGDVPAQLSCGAPYFDSCLCRTDLVGQGVQFLSSCVNAQCQNGVDVSQAVAEYLGYCGFTTVSTPVTVAAGLANGRYLTNG